MPIRLLGLTAVAAWFASLLSRHIRDRRYGAAVTLLAYGAAGVAADLAQHVVADLKDPERPGAWDSVAAASVKREAVVLLRALYPLAVDFVTRVLHDPAKVDALLGTLVERAVVELKAHTAASPLALDAPVLTPTPSRDTLAPQAPSAQRGRASVGALLVALAASLAVPFTACGPRPVPPDGGATVTPSGVLAVIDTVAGVLDVLLPFLRPLLLREVPDGPAKAPVMLSFQAFEATGRAWLAGRATWDARGADRCTAYALSGALTDATRQLARDLARAGIGWGPDLDALLTSLGRLMDRQLGACPSVDGGALTATGRVGATIRAELDALDADARRHGLTLQPLPPVSR